MIKHNPVKSRFESLNPSYRSLWRVSAAACCTTFWYLWGRPQICKRVRSSCHACFSWSVTSRSSYSWLNSKTYAEARLKVVFRIFAAYCAYSRSPCVKANKLSDLVYTLSMVESASWAPCVANNLMRLVLRYDRHQNLITAFSNNLLGNFWELEHTTVPCSNHYLIMLCLEHWTDC